MRNIRIEITNPGTLISSKNVDRLICTSPESRNEILAQAFRRYHICEERGTGFVKTILAIELSGTSTLAIAKAAKVNETLFFHHFGNKEKLWQKVKAYVVESILIEPLNPEPKTLHSFLEEIISQRLFAYQQKPELARLLQWQHMEAKQDRLIAGNTLAPTNWLPVIRYLQKTGKIKTEIQPEFIMIWLTASINTLIFDRIQIFQEENNRTAYIECLLSGFERALTS